MKTKPENNHIRYHNRTYYKCIDCGERASNNGGRCRKCRAIFAKANKKGRLYPCRSGCGNTTTKRGSRCRECYLKEGTRKVLNPARTYPCRSCGNPIKRQNGLCITCYNKAVQENAERKEADNKRRKIANEKRLHVKFGDPQKSICPKSPDKHHLEIITDNIGVCKYCKRTKDYNKLLEPYLPSIGM